MKMVSKKSDVLSAEQADKLLELLGSDDDFRAQFAADPVRALASVGYTGPAARLGGDDPTASIAPFATCSVENLATKDVIAQSRERLRQDLMQGLAYTTPQLEA